MLRCLRLRIACPSIMLFSVATSTLSVIVLNSRFWYDVISIVRPVSNFDVFFIASMYSLMVVLHAALLLLMPRDWLIKAAAAIIFILGAVTAYFVDNLGVSFDKTIIRSLIDTNRQEASALLTWRFVSYLLFAGIVPSIMIYFVKLPRVDSGEFRRRVAFIGAALLISAALVIGMFSVYAPFWRANKAIAHKLNPDAAVVATFDYIRSLNARSSFGPMSNAAGATRALAVDHGRKPLLLFLNIGETARAANFQLGGYGRKTNPELAGHEGVYYFSNASSCGTVTAISVPCMFFHGGRRIFDVYAREANLLDAVASGGYRVEWRENNTGGKGVPDRIKTIAYGPDTDQQLCVHGSCFDEIMTIGLAGELRAKPQNTVIVFHQMGSHGPSYWQRYPKRFEKFVPACETNELWRCSRDELLNVYDNTILYTDHVLAQQIRMMHELSDQFDSIMIYVSDHGESLGEHGLYLHGAPFRFSPKEQTHIPFLMWLSSGFQERLGMDSECLRAHSAQAVSHDNVYHTVLGALGLRNDVYKHELDLVTPCARRVGSPS